MTPTDFGENKYVHITERTVTNKGAERGRLIPKDSVMVTCIASIGEVAMASKECITNQQINTIICNGKINPHFIYYEMLYNKPVLKRWAGITTSPIIKKSLFEKFPIPLPPLPEQQRIAEILGTVDEGIEKVDKAIEKTESLKKGLMQELLTKGIGHKEFKNTRIGRIPKEWEVKRVSDLFKVETGTTPSTKKNIFWANGSINWFTPNDLNKLDNKIYLTTSERKISEKALEKVSMTMLPESSLILSTRAPVGYVAVLKEKATFNQGCKGLIPKNSETTKSEFYCYYLRNKKYNLQMKSAGSTFKELSKEALETFKIPFMKLSEQQKIVKILSTVDKKIDMEKKRKEKLEKIKEGLMQDLLTGRKRVKV